MTRCSGCSGWRRGSAAGFVRTRNEHALLPLDPRSLRRMAVLGPNAAGPRTLGGGSATVFPPYRVSPLDGLRAALEPGVAVSYSPGVRSHTRIPLARPSLLHLPGTSEPGALVEFLAREAWGWALSTAPAGSTPGAASRRVYGASSLPRSGSPARSRQLPPAPMSSGAQAVVNLAGVTGPALFARPSLRFYLRTHSLIGGAFLVEQTWFVIAFPVHRPAAAVSRNPGSWLLAFGGTFAGVLFRLAGAHPHWGAQARRASALLG
jgi:Glycosyl hydrolase family 3 C-terminal domain